MDKKTSSRMAPIVIGFGVMGLVALYSEVQQEHLSFGASMAGIGTAVLITSAVGISSYRKTHRGFSQEDLRTIKRTTNASRLYPLLGLLGFVAFVIATLTGLLDNLYPYVLGLGGSLFVTIGALIVIDNYWLRSIFLWNLSDKAVQNTWHSK